MSITKGNPYSRSSPGPEWPRKRLCQRGYLALTFGTLLSSQGTGALRHLVFRPASGQLANATDEPRSRQIEGLSTLPSAPQSTGSGFPGSVLAFREAALRTGHRDPVSVAPYGATSRTLRAPYWRVKSRCSGVTDRLRMVYFCRSEALWRSSEPDASSGVTGWSAVRDAAEASDLLEPVLHNVRGLEAGAAGNRQHLLGQVEGEVHGFGRTQDR